MTEQHSFIIPIATLQEKVEKHTSVLGKHRSADGMAHLLEQFALTEGESFLFDDYLPEAATKTYNWIKAFGRNLTDGYCLFKNGSLVREYENNGVQVTMNDYVQELPIVVIPMATNMYSCLLNAAASAVNEDKTYDVTISLPVIKVLKGEAASLSYSLKAKYITLADGQFDDLHEIEIESGSITADKTFASSMSFQIHVDQDTFDTVLQRIESVELTLSGYDTPVERTYQKGAFIEHVTANGTSVYGVQSKTDTKVDVPRWYDTDIRNSVIFHVELPDWQDRNMLPAAQDAIENALMNYIMYRWFETVQEDSVRRVGNQWKKVSPLWEVYYAKWEEKAREAQLALNSERRILQRKSTWL